MCWLKRDLRKVGIAIAGMLLLLAFMVCAPVLVAGAHERVLGLATPGTVTVHATPTEDATVVAAQKDKIVQDDIAANNANNWWRTNTAALITALSGLGVLIFSILGILIGFRGANKVRIAAQEQQKDQLFQNTIEGLGSERIEARTIAASMLLTFLHQPGYERFHQQIFNLAVTNLRLHHVAPSTLKRLDPLSQVLTTVFKDSFPLARKASIGKKKRPYRYKDKGLVDLDASRIKLDNAFLRYADLEGIWMRDAYLSGANLRKANLSNAYLTKTDLSDAYLHYVNLCGARLRHAVLSRAHLKGADLRGAYLHHADLRGAYLHHADLRDADLDGAILQGAKYNTKKIQEKDGQGKLVTIEPTQWPQGFDFRAAKAICVDCVSVCLIVVTPQGSIPIKTEVTTSTTFTDLGSSDPHKALWYWGDGTPTALGTVTESNGSGSVSNSHTYTSAGSYNVKITITANDGGTATTESQIQVYNPDPDKTINGTGHIESPAGAEPSSPSTTKPT